MTVEFPRGKRRYGIGREKWNGKNYIY